MRDRLDEREEAHGVPDDPRYGELLDFLPVPVLTLDRAGIIREINLRASADLVVDRRVILGHPFVNLVSRAQRPLFRRHMSLCRRGGPEPVSTRLDLAVRGGPSWPAQVVSRRSTTGEHYWTALIDRRDRRQLESETEGLRASELGARRSSEAKDVFIAVLGHELRTPLTALLAAAARLDQSDLSAAEVKKLAAMIKRNALAQVRLVDDLMDVTRLMRGKLELALGPVDLHEIVQEAVETFATEIASKRLLVAFELAAHEHVVNGDAGRLRQVFWNLIKNAIKFTPTGGRLGIRSWNNARRAVVEVSDSGIGIEAGELARLFVPFEQAARGGEGLGLGLSIAKTILELHGGSIAAASSGTGRGSRFVVELDLLSPPPVGRRAPRALGTLAPPRERRAREPRSRLPGILLVEDNRDLGDLLAGALRENGYEVKVATSLRDALRVDVEDVDVLVSDIQLPDGAGLDLLRLLSDKRPLPGIALSGYGGLADVKASRAAGFSAHLRKPIDMSALLAAIESATAGRRATRGG